MTDYYQPVSLGAFCETKYQLVRHMYFNEFPNRTPLSLRVIITTQDHGERLYGWELFDWQTTPLDTLLAYLECDFEGVFERADLMIDGGKSIVHRRLGTVHLHDFERIEHWTDELLDQAYTGARSRFEKRVRRFREMLVSPGPYLYVNLADALPSADQINRLVELLGARSPEHRFKLLIITEKVADADPSAFSDKVVFSYRAGVASADVAAEWEWWGAHDGEWDAALSQFKLIRRGQTPPGDAPAAATASEPAAKSRGLFSLFGGKA